MGAFSKGRPESAGGTGQPPSWHSSGTQSALAKAGGANPLLVQANPSFGAGGGARSTSFGQQGAGGAPVTGYGALARGNTLNARPEGYWGAKTGTGAGQGYAQPSKGKDVWTPAGTSGFVGKQPKGAGSGNKSGGSGKPKPAAGATKDGSPWAPPLRRVVVNQSAMRAMRLAADAPTPPGLLDNTDFKAASSQPDLHHLDKKFGEAEKDHGGHYVRSSLFAPPAPPNGGPHGKVRRSLPVYQYRTKLIDAFVNNPVTIVEGETGSGKTTQVAQYLLEHASETNAPVNIICTQPRRISAIGVAERVASERGEPRVGVGAVGYAIRGETKVCDDTRLLFCTTGVLLRRLEKDPTLQGITHVLVDEVHERTVEGDFLLMALKEMLARKEEAGDTNKIPMVKVGLMSATMDGDVLAKYFDGAPRVSFPGRAFPVATLHLEDAIATTKHWVDRQAEWCHGSHANQRKSGKAAAKDESKRPPSEPEWAQRLQRSNPNQTRARAACRSLSQLDTDVVNQQLICELVKWFVDAASGDVDKALSLLPGAHQDRWDRGMAQTTEREKDDGGSGAGGTAILIFLPGTKEIDNLRETLVAAASQSSGRSGGAGGGPVLDPDWILPLHGALPPDDQRRVFQRPPPGKVKVVLSTNVAETSITIDDVVCVIDTGRVKEERYDAERLMSSLDDVPVSAAAAKQRRGRAGRVRPGIAFHLFPSDAPLNKYTDPEVRRVGLQQLVMRVKALSLPGSAEQVCARLPEPPELLSVRNAVEDLRCIGALAHEDEHLTPLGKLLSQLPTDARLGKLVVYGCALGMTDEALTLASLLGSRSPFLMPGEAREAADESKKRFGVTPQSDVLGALAAYNAFDALPGQQRFEFARERFLSIKTLQQVANSKRQLLENLSSLGVVPRGIRKSHVEYVGRRHDGSDGVRLVLGQLPVAAVVGLDEASGGGQGQGGHTTNFGQGFLPPPPGNGHGILPPPPAPNGEPRLKPPPSALLAGLLCAGLYPQLAYLHAPPTKKGAASSSAVKLHVRAADRTLSEPDAASVHPGSVNGMLDGNAWRSCYVAFHERVKTSKVYVRDSTPVPPLAMMLLAGGELHREHGSGNDGNQLYETGGDGYDEILALDGYYRMHVPTQAAELVVKLREKIQGLVRRLILDVDATRKNASGGGRDGRGGGVGFHKAQNGPAPPWTGDKEGETIVRDMVEALTHISKWEDVRVVPEMSGAERKKIDAQRKHALKTAEQRRLKAAKQQQHGQRKAGPGGGRGGGRGGRGKGGGGKQSAPVGGQGNWSQLQNGGGTKRGRDMGGGGPPPNPKRHKKF